MRQYLWFGYRAQNESGNPGKQPVRYLKRHERSKGLTPDGKRRELEIRELVSSDDESSSQEQNEDSYDETYDPNNDATMGDEVVDQEMKDLSDAFGDQSLKTPENKGIKEKQMIPFTPRNKLNMGNRLSPDTLVSAKRLFYDVLESPGASSSTDPVPSSSTDPSLPNPDPSSSPGPGSSSSDPGPYRGLCFPPVYNQ